VIEHGAVDQVAVRRLVAVTVAAIEFGPTVRARSLIAYGNASQPGSPHVGDQLELFAKKQLKPVWRTRPDVEANLEKKETVRATGGGR
jgi:acyl-homoserine lactone acylase PvdQ